MDNKPKGVIWHEHFFPTKRWRKETCRVDAVELETGEFGVWDVDEDTFIYVESRAVASATAWCKAKKKSPTVIKAVRKMKDRKKKNGLDRS